MTFAPSVISQRRKASVLVFEEHALLNQSLALRCVPEVEDEIEDARKRESMDYGLLDRGPEEMELEDAAGPIAKKLMRQE